MRSVDDAESGRLSLAERFISILALFPDLNAPLAAVSARDAFAPGRTAALVNNG
jgi:hypothetical protein